MIKVKINSIRGEPALRSMVIAHSEPDETGRKGQTVLVYSKDEIPPEMIKPSWVTYVEEVEVDEEEPGFARALAEGVLTEVKRGPGRPRKSKPEDETPAQVPAEL